MNRKELLEQASQINNPELRKLIYDYEEAKEKKKPVNKILNLLHEKVRHTKGKVSNEILNLLNYYKN